MLQFDELHIFKNFSDFEEKKKWWLGRLVECKNSVANLFLKTPEVGELGIVAKVEQTAFGFVLEVHWFSGLRGLVSPNNIYSQKE